MSTMNLVAQAVIRQSHAMTEEHRLRPGMAPYGKTHAQAMAGALGSSIAAHHSSRGTVLLYWRPRRGSLALPSVNGSAVVVDRNSMVWRATRMVDDASIAKTRALTMFAPTFWRALALVRPCASNSAPSEASLKPDGACGRT